MSLPAIVPTSAPVTPGSGSNIATIEINGQLIQLIALTDGSLNPINGDGNGNLFISMGSGLRQDLDSVTSFPNGKVTSSVLTASGQAVPIAGKIYGLFIASGTPTITAYDGTSTSGVVKLPAFAVISAPYYLPLPGFSVGLGLYLAITGTTSLVCFYDASTS